MLDRIIGFSLGNRLLVMVAAMLLMVGGFWMAQKTEVDVFPDLNAPTVVVMTEAGGLSAEEVEQLVTLPVETAVNGGVGVRRVRSSSTAGFSVVWVEFDWDTDPYIDRQIISEKLAQVGDQLPPSAGSPVIGPQSSILGEVLIVSLTSDDHSMLELREMAERTVRTRLQSIDGVAQVSVIGGDMKEYQVMLNPERMNHYGVTLPELLEATRGISDGTNGGVLYQYGNEYIVRGVVPADALERLQNAVVKRTPASESILVSDIAEVRVGGQTPKLGTASERGKDAVLLTVSKQPAVGTIELTQRLDEAVDELRGSLPKGVEISTDIFRQSRFIESSIDNVKDSLLEGGVFVVVVLLLFLGNVRTTLISLVTIPLSLLVTIIVLHLTGNTLNTMSLGGMAIAIGSLVDDAIVDVENVWKRIGENRNLDPSRRRPLLRVVYEASREVRMPILNSTLIIIVSFVPLFFLGGMEGRMLVPLGVAFIVSLIASTLVALTVTPVLCSYLLDRPKLEREYETESRVTRFVKRHYMTLLTWTLRHKSMILGVTAVLLVATIGVFFTLGRSFLPPFNEGSFTINVSTLPGVSLEESDRIGHQAEELLLSVDEIQTVARKTGRAELDEHALGVNVSEIEAPFSTDGRPVKDILEEVRHKLSMIAGANVEIGQPISHRIDAMLSGTQASIAIKLFGDDLNKMYGIANRIKEEIEDVEGIADLNVEQQIERPELKIRPRMQMLANYGITLPQFNEFISVMMGGEKVGQVYENGYGFDIVVKGDTLSRATIGNIGRMLIDTPDGYKVPLENVADIESSTGPNSIGRENVKRKIVVSANTHGRDVGSVVSDIRSRIDRDVELPEGYHIEYGGQFESERSASRILLLTSLLSILVIYLLLYMQFDNALESGVILLNLPFALIGGVLVLRFTSGEVSIPAIIGFISLFGIATRNGMLLVTRYDILRNETGAGIYDCVIRGSLDRMNPILMTAMTSALALIPLAARGDLPGNEIQSPMALVILGGLLSSTFLNAFILPIVYMLIHKMKDGDKSTN